MEAIHVEPFVDGASVEQILVGRDGEQGLGQLGHTGEHEVLQVLRGQHQAGVLLPSPLEDVADVLNGHFIGQPDVKLVKGSHRVAHRQELVGEVGQDVEQHGVLDVSAALEEALDAKDHKPPGADIGMSVEKPRLSALAHGVEAQEDLLEHFLGEQGLFLSVIVLIDVLHQLVEVGEDGILAGADLGEVRGVAHAPFGVEPLHQQLNGVNVEVGEAFVGAEEVLEKGDVLGEQGFLPEGCRGVGIVLAVHVPELGFQRIDAILTAQEVDKAAAQIVSHVRQFMFRIEGDHALTALQDVADEQLEQIALALAGVTQDEGAASGLVLGPALHVHQDIGAELVPADVETLGVGLAGMVEGIQVANRCGGQYPLKQGPEGVGSSRVGGLEALPLAEKDIVHAQLRAGQLGHDLVLQHLQGVRTLGGKLQKDGAVDERLLVSLHGGDEGDHVLKVGLGGHALLEVVGVAPLHAALVTGVMKDGALLGGGHFSSVDPEGHAALFPKVAEECQFLSAGGVASEGQYAAVGAAQNKAVRVKTDGSGGDHVHEVLGFILRLGLDRRFFLLLRFLLHGESPRFLHRSCQIGR